jgi:hypothetical protein
MTARRWHIPAAFVTLVVVSVLLVWLNDHRTDQAIRRSNAALLTATAALARSEANSAVNRSQDAIRRELVDLFCEEIESIKERIRATVRVNSRARFAETLRRVNPDVTDEQIDALYQQAKAQEQEVQERFAPRDCATVPGG